MILTLDQAPSYTELEIVDIDKASSEQSAMLKRIGFVRGARVSVRQRLPMRGPLIINLGSIDCALRLQEAKFVKIRVAL
jgi:Fe2+ transport system protein FeoA